MYYKVVNKYLQSIITTNSIINQQYSVQYKINEFVQPILKNSKLMVFDSFKRAKDFQDQYGGLIFACDVVNPVLATRVGFIHEDHIIYFWDDTKSVSFDGSAPEGTYFCDEVRLLWEVRSV